MNSEIAVYRASTSGLSGAHDIEHFREHFGRAILRLEMMPLEGHPLGCDVVIRSLPDVAVATGSLSPMSNHHPAELGDDALVLAVMRSGRSEFRQARYSTPVRAGEAILTANADAGTFTGFTATHMTNIRLRRELLAPHLDPDAGIGQPIAANDYALRLLLAYTDVLADRDVAMNPEAHRMVTTNIYDLAALAIGGIRDARAAGRGVRAARLHAIKTDIRRNLGQQDLSIGSVARRHGISASYVRRMFAAEQSSFSEYVLGQRLVQAHRILSDPRFTHRTISSIAFELGFGDLSYFNRTFRRRYGATPSDVRATVM